MDPAAEIRKKPVSKHQHKFSPSIMENEQADAGRDGGTCVARPNSQARMGTGKYSFSLLS